MKYRIFVVLMFFVTVAKAQNYDVFDDCALGGSPVSHDDSLKNRYNISKKYTSVTFQDIFILKKTDKMPAANVKFRGYCLLVKDGGSETCNCKSKDKKDMDTHIEIVEDSSVDQVNTNSVICEVNSRIRDIMSKKGIDWSTKTLKKQMVGHMVEIGGYGFFDSKHHWQNSVIDNPDGSTLWRHTTFEVHPVTYIKILD